MKIYKNFISNKNENKYINAYNSNKYENYFINQNNDEKNENKQINSYISNKNENENENKYINFYNNNKNENKKTTYNINEDKYIISYNSNINENKYKRSNSNVNEKKYFKYYTSYKKNSSNINSKQDNNENNYKKLMNELAEERKKNLKLIEELNLEKDKVKELADIENQILAINFISVDQKVHYPMACKKDDKFSQIEEKLFNEYPNYKNCNTFFTTNGKIIDREKTLKENGIKTGDTIILNLNEF